MTDSTNNTSASQIKRKRTSYSSTKQDTSVIKETHIGACKSYPYKGKQKDDLKVDPTTLVSAKLSAKQDKRLELIAATLETLPFNVDNEAKEFASLVLF